MIGVHADMALYVGRWRVKLLLLPRCWRLGFRGPARVGWSGGFYLGPVHVVVDRLTVDGRHEWRAT